MNEFWTLVERVSRKVSSTGVRQGVATDSLKYRQVLAMLYRSTPCGRPPLKEPYCPVSGVAYRTVGGLQPSSTPLDPQNRTPPFKGVNRTFAGTTRIYKANKRRGEVELWFHKNGNNSLFTNSKIAADQLFYVAESLPYFFKLYQN
jgi:hypothetical protein